METYRYYDLIIAQFVPNPIKFPRVIEIPTSFGLSWQTWAVILLCILLIMIFEGAHHQIKSQMKPKPVLLSNRQELFAAIHHLDEVARDTIEKHREVRKCKKSGILRDVPKSKDDKAQDKHVYSEVFIQYCEAQRQLGLQASIAGQSFRQTLEAFGNTIRTLVLSHGIPGNFEVDNELNEAIRKVKAEIDIISQ